MNLELVLHVFPVWNTEVDGYVPVSCLSLVDVLGWDGRRCIVISAC